jgi:hypothetical protein
MDVSLDLGMGVRNKISEFIEGRLQITPYQFSKETGISLGTTYTLCNKRGHYPDKSVVEKIFQRYGDLGISIADLIEWGPNEDG